MCRVVSFLFDLAKWALEVQHARMFADDVVEQPTLEVRQPDGWYQATQSSSLAY